MDYDETVIGSVERLERVVVRLERIVNGDSELSTPGLLAQHIQLMKDVDEMKRRQPQPISWVIGYFLFVTGLLPLFYEVREFFNMHTNFSIVLVVILMSLALMFFAYGLGFIKLTE